MQLLILFLTLTSITPQKTPKSTNILKLHTDSPKTITPDQYCIRRYAPETPKCKTCVASLKGSDLRCHEPTIKIEKCLEYSSEGKCSYCQYNYFLNSSQKCEKIKSNCAYQEIFDNSEICFMCQPGILVKDGKCDSDNKCGIQDCYACRVNKDGVSEECFVCKNGFVLNGGKCEQVEGKLEHCWMYDGVNVEVCNMCRIGYFVNDNGGCEKSEMYDLELFAFGKVFVVNFLMIVVFLSN